MDYDNQEDSFARHRNAIPLVLNEIIQMCKPDFNSKVLEVGSGTGLQITTLVKDTHCYGWGIEPSTNMLKYAISNDRLHFLQGYAEKLPFEADFFDIVFTINVIHHLESTSSYFKEAFRVLKPGGTICTATDSEKKIRNRKPLSVYWPSTVEIDINRYPSISTLRMEMIEAGFTDIFENDVLESFEETNLERYREKAFSCLRLISEQEHLHGLSQLENDLKKDR